MKEIRSGKLSSISTVESERLLVRVVVYAVRHHDDHRLCLSFCDKVVKDLGCSSQVAPRILVTAASVKQVEYGIFCLRIVLITGRGVDGDSSLRLESGGVLPNVRD